MTHTASATAIIALPREKAWEKLQDFSLAHNYVPGIVKTQLVSEQLQGVGASRYVYQTETRYVQETVEQWREGHGFTIRLHKGDKPAPPFKTAHFTYQLDDAENGMTRLTTTLGYELPGGMLGRLAGKAMLGFVQKTITDVAVSMKLFYETGNPTTKQDLQTFKG